MARGGMIKIDSDRLYAAIRERGLQFRDICDELGVNKSFFSNAKARGSISSMAVVTLESRFGIPRTLYTITDDVVTANVIEVHESTKNVFEDEETQKSLYKIIYAAVYDAMHRALNE